MADIKSPEARSFNMSRLRCKDTKPEEYIRKRLYAEGFRYRKNYRAVTGCPDVWLPKYNLAVFIHGCFWHRHRNCKYAYSPKSRESFWESKFQRNIERDRAVRDELSQKGTRVLVIWECTIRRMIKSTEFEKECLKRICEFISSDCQDYEL